MLDPAEKRVAPSVSNRSRNSARSRVDKVIPVDIYLPGCPPRPEALIDAIRKLQERIRVRGGKSMAADEHVRARERITVA